MTGKEGRTTVATVSGRAWPIPVRPSANPPEAPGAGNGGARRFDDPVQQEAWDAVPDRLDDARHARRVRIEVSRLLLAGAGTGGPHVALLQELNARIDAMSGRR